MNTVYLSIGSNTDAETNLRQIVRLLREKLNVVAVSPVYESVDADGGEMVYLNAALMIKTSLDAEGLKIGILEPIEDRLERESSGVFVTADIDIVLFNNDVMTYLGRTIPDPGVTKHAFVVLPLADIAPAYVHPVTGQMLAVIAEKLSEDALKRRDDIVL